MHEAHFSRFPSQSSGLGFLDYGFIGFRVYGPGRRFQNISMNERAQQRSQCGKTLL